MKNIIRLVSIILCVFLYYGISCAGDGGGAAPGDTEEAALPEGVDAEIYACMTEENKELLADPTLPEYLRELIIGTTACPRADTSIDLINKAAADGTLRDEWKHIFKLLVYLEPERVPEQFRNDEPLPDTSAIVSTELQWLLDYWDTIPDEVITEYDLYKFTRPPDDPESGFNVQKASATKGADAPADSGELQPGWKPKCVGTDCNIQIIYPTEYESIANKVSELVNRALPNLRQMFGIQSIVKAGPVKMFVQVSSPVNDYVIVRPPSGACEIALSITSSSQDVDVIDEEPLQSDIAYDLARCFHFELYAEEEGREASWKQYPHRDISFAIGTFAVDDIFPANNFEHQLLDDFFKEVGGKQWKKGEDALNEKEYMWSKFLKQRFGNYDAIRTALVFATTQGLSALMSAVPFYDEEYKKYAQWNLNMASFRKYADQPEFPTVSPKCGSSGKCMPKDISFKRLRGYDDEEEDFGVDIGAIQYWHYYFLRADEDINEVIFKFQPKPNLHHGIQVFGTKTPDDINATWELIGDIGPAGREARICIPRDGFKEFIVILSNADIGDNAQAWHGSYTIEKNAFCALGGTTIISDDQHWSDGTALKAVFQQNIDVKPSEDEYGASKYVIVKRTMEYTGELDTMEMILGYNPVTGEVLESVKCDSILKGTLTETYSAEDGPVVLMIDEDGKGGELYAYPRPRPENENWVKQTQRCVSGGTMASQPPTEEEIMVPPLGMTEGRVLKLVEIG